MGDILIIGGGMAGLSAAAALSEIGTVTVLEAEAALGTQATGRSAALFEERYGLPSTRALNAASRDYLETHEGGVLSPRGLMLIGGPEDADRFAADCADMGLTPIDIDAARARVPLLDPETTRFAGFHADAWDIDTDRLLQGFRRRVQSRGGTVVTGAQVRAIVRTPGGWAVETATARHTARLLVNAAGAWADAVATLAGVAPLGLTPLRRSVARIPAPAGMDVSGWPMLLGCGETWYAKPDAGALIVSPADEDPVEPHDAWAEDLVLAEGIARYEHHVTAPVTRLLSSWAGLRTFAPDRQLVLGPDPEAAGFIWCAGQGGYGIQTSPAAGRLLRDLVGGTAPELPAETVRALSPARFR